MDRLLSALILQNLLHGLIFVFGNQDISCFGSGIDDTLAVALRRMQGLLLLRCQFDTHAAILPSHGYRHNRTRSHPGGIDNTPEPLYCCPMNLPDSLPKTTPYARSLRIYVTCV
jgi:hypothetical protein